MAKLRGVAPAAIKKRLKVLFFGEAGVGKTTAAIQFPKPYLIDTERGAENDQYVKLLKASGGAYYHTTDFDDMLQEVIALLTTKHEFRTLIIDPLTVPYNDALDKSAKSLATKSDVTGTEFQRHKQAPDRKVKHLLALLLRLDMTVIITSHAKAEWKNSAPTGQNTFDCYNKLDYLFDLVIEMKKIGGAKDSTRTAIVRKTRIESFPLGDSFPFAYAEFAARYGNDLLESVAAVETLATVEQVAEIKRLIELVNVPADKTEKWLEKAGAERWEEMPAESIAKCILYLHEQVTKGAA